MSTFLHFITTELIIFYKVGHVNDALTSAAVTNLRRITSRDDSNDSENKVSIQCTSRIQNNDKRVSLIT